jgi:hypothetical protein
MNMKPMNIQSSIAPNTNRNSIQRILDGGLILCAIGVFLALLFVLDAYGLPGMQSHRTNRVSARAGAPLSAPRSEVTEPAEITATIQTKYDIAKENIEKEIAKAELLIEQKRQELEKLSVAEVEAVADEEGVDDTKLKADAELITIGDSKAEETIQQDKEEVIEEIVEKELGIDEFCPECIWLETSPHRCDKRLKWLMAHYNLEEDAGKESLLEQGCRKKSGGRRRLGRWS